MDRNTCLRAGRRRGCRAGPDLRKAGAHAACAYRRLLWRRRDAAMRAAADSDASAWQGMLCGRYRPGGYADADLHEHGSRTHSRRPVLRHLGADLRTDGGQRGARRRRGAPGRAGDSGGSGRPRRSGRSRGRPGSAGGTHGGHAGRGRRGGRSRGKDLPAQILPHLRRKAAACQRGNDRAGNRRI